VIGPVKIDPGASYLLTLRAVPPNSRVSADLQVAFNSKYSLGTPDVYLLVDGPDGVLVPRARVGSGYPLSFIAKQGGDYRITISNEHSKINAKQVLITFR
jgi:hypothetical protein